MAIAKNLMRINSLVGLLATASDISIVKRKDYVWKNRKAGYQLSFEHFADKNIDEVKFSRFFLFGRVESVSIELSYVENQLHEQKSAVKDRNYEMPYNPPKVICDYEGSNLEKKVDKSLNELARYLHQDLPPQIKEEIDKYTEKRLSQ